MSGVVGKWSRLPSWFAIVTVGLVALVAAGCGSSKSDQAQEQKVQEIKGEIQRLQRDIAQHQTARDAARDRGNRGKHVKNPYGPAPAISGGRLMGGGLGVVSSGVLEPQTSSWTVTSHASDTVVVAGGDARHPSDGLFSITRSSYLDGTQKGDEVPVPGSGPVTITKAPVGRKIVVSAQKHGNFEFKGKSGITGTLHLKDDSITLDQ
jgi:outer membrane murein-binding lipoprotein Lpp